ncbi:IclR family transcriptional regulator [Saccharopolyspora mangrovi]|uniref:IclR family transcriptional regulator n=1 Tax=Saccharopolyspora mangrovi TaxID=3082379 RepID=A0ABU6ADU0_9PSEU|nr:IclR family transcriptional regulator [Saccharopolyspora sp. S2-29]MEB3369694.1 IclR family transcriptional regulator [Saccharopolyspora sp. S2-29]
MDSNSRRTAADKTLDVLEALAEHSSVAELAQATGLSKPTVHRILQTLTQRGFSRNTGSGCYVSGPRILTLAGQFLQQLDLPGQVRPALQELQERTGWTVHFALLHGDEAVYAVKVEGSKPYHLASRVGMSMCLHSTSAGKSMLACMTDEAVRALLGRAGMPARTPKTHTDVESLLRELDHVRTAGYAEDHQENEDGVIAVGAPVFDHLGQVIGGISAAALAYPGGATGDFPEHGALVTDAARQISLSFGAPPHRSDLRSRSARS